MRLKKTLWKILLPLVVLGTTVVVIAQANGRKLFFEEQKSTVEHVTDEPELTNDDPWEELKKVYKEMDGDRHLIYSGKIRLHEEDELLEETTYSCEMNLGNYIYSIDSVDMIFNEGLSLNVYHRDKLIMFGKERSAITAWWSLSNVDSLKKYAQHEGAEVSVLRHGTNKIIKVENTGNPDLYGYELHYNSQSYAINKLVLQITSLDDFENEALSKSETGKDAEESPSDSTNTDANVFFNLYEVEVTFDQFTVQNPAADFHPEEKYLNVRKEKIQVKDTYKDYQIVAMNGVESFKNR